MHCTVNQLIANRTYSLFHLAMTTIQCIFFICLSCTTISMTINMKSNRTIVPSRDIYEIVEQRRNALSLSSAGNNQNPKSSSSIGSMRKDPRDSNELEQQEETSYFSTSLAKFKPAVITFRIVVLIFFGIVVALLIWFCIIKKEETLTFCFGPKEQRFFGCKQIHSGRTRYTYRSPR